MSDNLGATYEGAVAGRSAAEYEERLRLYQSGGTPAPVVGGAPAPAPDMRAPAPGASLGVQAARIMAPGAFAGTTPQSRFENMVPTAARGFLSTFMTPVIGARAASGATVDRGLQERAAGQVERFQAEVNDLQSRLSAATDPAIRRQLEEQLTLATDRLESIQDIAETTPESGRSRFERGVAGRDAALDEALPVNAEYEGEFLQNLAAGAGNMAAFVTTALFTGGAGALGLGASYSGVSQYEEAVAAGASDEDALAAAGLGFLVGTTDAIPLMRALRGVGGRQAQSRFVGAAIRLLKAGGEEAVQEALQTTMENMIAQRFYDPDRETFAGVGEAGAIGFFLGAGVRVIGEARSKASTGRSGPLDAPDAPAPPLEPAIDEDAPTVSEGGVGVTRSDLPSGLTEGDIAEHLGDAEGPEIVIAPSAEEAAQVTRETIRARDAFITANEGAVRVLERIDQERVELGPHLGGSLVDRIIGVESGGRADAAATTSSALGAGQFIKGTWLAMIERYRPDLMEGRSREQVLAMRTDPALSREMTERYMQENAAKLQRAGLEASDANLYLAHFAGPQGAINLLRADPDAPVSSVLTADAIAANRFLQGKTVGWVVQWANGKIGSATSARARAAVLTRRENKVVEALTEALAKDARASAESRTPELKLRAAERLKLASEAAQTVEAITELRRMFRQDQRAQDDMDKFLNQLRRGRRTVEERMSRRPALMAIKRRGGVEYNSPFGQELRNLGVTPSTLPGLFRKPKFGGDFTRTAGHGAFDNIPRDEEPIFAGGKSDDGYITEQEWIDAVAAELAGSPLRSPEEEGMIADDPVAGMYSYLEDLGIDINKADNRTIKEALAKAEDEARRIADLMEASAAETGDRLVAPEDLSEIAEIVDGEPDPDAPPLDSDPRAPETTKREGRIFVNFARITSPEDVKKLIQRVADMDAERIETEVGKKSWGETIKEGDAAFADITDFLGREPGPLTRGEVVAAKKILASSAEQLLVLSKRAVRGNASPAALYAFRRAMQVHYAIQMEFFKARAETARALNAFAIPTGSDPMRLQMVSELIAQDGGASEIQKMARQIEAMANLPPHKLNGAVRVAVSKRIGHVLMETWTAGLLSGPPTHIVNALSNGLTTLWGIPERAVRGVIANISGGDARIGEAKAAAFALVQGIRDGITLAAHRVSGDLAETIEPIAGNGDKLVEGLRRYGGQDAMTRRQFDLFARDNMNTNGLSGSKFGDVITNRAMLLGMDYIGRFIRLPFYALQTADLFFKGVNYRMEVAALAYREASMQGLTGEAFAAHVRRTMADPPSHIDAAAIDVAHINTFTNALGQDGNMVLALRERNQWSKLLIPFYKTPMNILKFTFQRTPLAPVAASVRAEIAAGGNRRDTALAKIASGSMLSIAIWSMAAEGLITGSGPDDPEENRLWREAGNQPYSVWIFGRWYQYSRLDPIGTIIGLTADMAEVAGAVSDGATAEEIATSLSLAVFQNVGSKTWMYGAMEFLSAIDTRNPTSTPATFLEGFAGTLMPYSSLLRRLGMADDPVLRDYRVTGGDDPAINWLYTMRNRWLGTIPGQSAALPVRRTLFGEPINRTSGLGWSWDFASPILSVEDKPDDPVIEAMIEDGLAAEITMPTRFVEGVELTGEEYSRLTEIAGKMAKQMLDQYAAAGALDRMPGGQGSMRSEFMRNIILRTREVARAQLISEVPGLQSRIIRARQQEAALIRGSR